MIFYTLKEQHLTEVKEKLRLWRSKPILNEIYKSFYTLIAENLNRDLGGLIAEIGSGIGSLKSLLPTCICTDIFENPWIDQVENAYRLSFSDSSVSNLILFDVFHHIEFPGTMLEEFYRVLMPRGRVIIFDPAISMLGFIVYGLFHHEPINVRREIKWFVPKHFSPEVASYYAAQGNATRIFFSYKYRKFLSSNWNLIVSRRMSAISYVASGGYSKPKLYPDLFLPVMKVIDKWCDAFPSLFATRMLVVLEKKERSET